MCVECYRRLLPQESRQARGGKRSINIFCLCVVCVMSVEGEGESSSLPSSLLNSQNERGIRNLRVSFALRLEKFCLYLEKHVYSLCLLRVL